MPPPEARLGRLVRLREAQRRIAASTLAARTAASARQEGLAARTAGMLDGAGGQDARSADELARHLTFGAGVAGLARAAADEAAHAGRQTLAARQALAAADRKLEYARERRDDARRASAARQPC